jgi:tetratricopeptide (TPR) repeat protein
VYPEISWLRDQGVHIWYDEGISGGRIWRAEIGNAIKSASKMLLYVSGASLSSDHCSREINFALDEGTEIVPIYLEDVELTVDLKLGLGRVQALMRRNNPRYRDQLLGAATDIANDSSLTTTAKHKTTVRRRWPWVAGIVALAGIASLLWLMNSRPPADTEDFTVRLGITPFASATPDTAGLEYEIERRLSASHGLLVKVSSDENTTEDYRLTGDFHGSALRVELRDRHGVRVASWTTEVDRDLAGMADSISRSMLIKLGRRDEVVSRFREQIDPGVFRTYLSAIALLRSSHSADALTRAENSFNEVLKAEPGYAPAHAGLCSTYLNLYTETLQEDQFHLAEKHCHRALTLNAQSSAVYISLGMLYRESGQMASAIDSFQQALSLAPYSTDAMRGLADTFDRSGSPEEAEHWYRQAIQVEPSHWQNYQALGIHQFMSGDFDSAIDSFKTAQTLAPQETGPPNNIGAAYFMAGDFQQAVSHWRRVAELEPSPQIYANLATSYFYQRQFQQAYNMYEKAHSAAPDDYRYLGHIGEVLRITDPSAAHRFFEQALELANKKLDIDPDHSLTLADMASYHAGLNQRESALSLLNRALLNDPADLDVLYSAAVCYSRLGETELTQTTLKQLKQGGYDATLLAADANFDGLYSDK